MFSARAWSMAMVLAPLAGGCGGDESAPVEPEGQRCPSGELLSPRGSCAPVGIQGCADLFLEEDGLCHPSPDKCPPGTIPKFSEGCIPVGIASCAQPFVEADGLCYPSPDKCPAGTFPVPTEGCVPIDGEEGCGSSTWGNIADAPGTVWVDASYAGGDGDGSQLKPVTTVAAALALVAPGGRIAMAAGDYAEAIALDFPVELVGRCPSLVALSGSAATPYDLLATVLVDGPQAVTLRSLRIGGAGIGVLAVMGTVDLEGVHLREATQTSIIAVTGASVHVDRTLIERTTSTPPGFFGRGIEVAFGAELVLTRSALVENRDPALFAENFGTRVTVRESIIARTLPQESDRIGGRGVHMQGGATLAMEASALLENREVALSVTATDVTVSESVIARTAPQESDSQFGRGAEVQQGGKLALTRAALVENREVALGASHSGTSVTMTESLIARTLPRETDRALGRGASVQHGAALTLEASALVENQEVALAAGHSGTSVIVNQSVIARTLPQEHDAGLGVGVLCADRASLDLRSSAVLDAATAAAILMYGATVSLRQALLEHVAAGSFNTYDCPPGVAYPCPGMDIIAATYHGIADGLVVGFGSSVEAEQTRVAGVARSAVLYHESTGMLRGVHAKGDHFGLVLQGQPRPDWQDADNLFEGGDQPIVSDGNLPVPEAPPLPQD